MVLTKPKMTDLKSIHVLCGNQGHVRTREKLDASFAMVFADPEQLADISQARRQEIRAIASFFYPVNQIVFDLLPNLEIVSSFGVGYDHIDTDHAVSRGVMVTHTPDVLNDEVADTTIALLLNTVRRLYHAETYLRQGQWEDGQAFPLTPLSMRGRTIGIFGLGRIGQVIAKRLSGFDVPVHYHSRRIVEGADLVYHDSLLGLAKAVDTLIAIVPGTLETYHAINADILSALGARGVLINVARGSVVDEKALIAALHNKTIAAAGLDVFEFEPEVPSSLKDLPNTCLLPHVASASQDTRMAMGHLVVDNLMNWFTFGKVLTSIPETMHLCS